MLSGFRVIVVQGMADPDWWRTIVTKNEKLLFVTPEVKLQLDRLTRPLDNDLDGALGQSHNKES